MSGHNTGAVLEGRVTTRGTTNSHQRGSSYARRRRREWLVANYAANRPLLRVEWEDGEISVDVFVLSAEALLSYSSIRSVVEVPACRCYRCGRLLTAETVTVDRIVPGCQGGTYRRNNIRPACGDCNSETGGRTRR